MKTNIKKIAQEKVTGLAEAFESVNKSVSDLDAYVGDIPTDEKYEQELLLYLLLDLLKMWFLPV